VGSRKYFCSSFPGYDLAHLRPGLTRWTRQRIRVLPRNRRLRRCAAHRESGHNFAAIFRLIRRTLGIEAGHEAVFDFVRVREDVAIIEFKDVSEVVYSGYKAVNGAWLDDVLPFPAQELLVDTRSRAADVIPRMHPGRGGQSDRLWLVRGSVRSLRRAVPCNKSRATSDPDAETILETKSGTEISGFKSKRPRRFAVRKGGVHDCNRPTVEHCSAHCAKAPPRRHRRTNRMVSARPAGPRRKKSKLGRAKS